MLCTDNKKVTQPFFEHFQIQPNISHSVLIHTSNCMVYRLSSHPVLHVSLVQYADTNTCISKAHHTTLWMMTALFLHLGHSLYHTIYVCHQNLYTGNTLPYLPYQLV